MSVSITNELPREWVTWQCEMDALVAEKVMGLTVLGFADCWAPEGDWSVRSQDGPPNRPVSLSPNCTGDDYHAELRAPSRTTSREWDRELLFGHSLVHCLNVVPCYSTDIAAAWKIVEKLQGDGQFMCLDAIGFDGEKWRCFFAWTQIRKQKAPDETVDVSAWIGEADTAALSICRAALKAAR